MGCPVINKSQFHIKYEIKSTSFIQVTTYHSTSAMGDACQDRTRISGDYS